MTPQFKYFLFVISMVGLTVSFLDLVYEFYFWAVWTASFASYIMYISLREEKEND